MDGAVLLGWASRQEVKVRDQSPCSRRGLSKLVMGRNHLGLWSKADLGIEIGHAHAVWEAVTAGNAVDPRCMDASHTCFWIWIGISTHLPLSMIRGDSGHSC